jgi:translation elongation factor EF-1alpha
MISDENIFSCLKRTGYQPSTIPFTPFSAGHGDNMIEVSEQMPWYQRWSVDCQEGSTKGMILVEALDTIRLPLNFQSAKHFDCQSKMF